MLFFSLSWPVLGSDCTLPKSLNGVTFLFKISESYTPMNVMPGNLLESRFSERHYTTEILNTGEKVRGVYTYQRYHSQFGRFHASEGTGEQLTQYAKTLVCKTDKVGYVIFSQSIGVIKPNVRQDTGTYVITSLPARNQ
ncbi:hypothetical protein [uncultured Shewanella sp.]|uniref:hypothetical protein n=1 Tax=uncultured Shewanella sp. TaxID=173975 RepID=UPI0026145C45|nr:hypothetical protein [uncultured Shewanella sp.]